jgi:hypothetical protein
VKYQRLPEENFEEEKEINLNNLEDDLMQIGASSLTKNQQASED